MRKHVNRGGWRGMAAFSLLLLPVEAHGQEPREGLSSPLVQEVSFSGTSELSDSALLEQLATQPTRCRSLLLAPICLFSDGDVVAERHRLDEEELPRDELRLRVIYFREGFRETVVAHEVLDRDDGVEVAFQLVEGQPTLLESLDIHQTEVALSDRDLEGARLPREGRPFSLNALTEGMDRLLDELRGRGFLDATIEDDIQVDPERRQATVRIEIQPGPRSTVRAFDVVGNEQIADATIVRALLIEEGDVLTLPLVRQSRSALHATNLFHEADVSVVPGPDSAKVVSVRVREAPPRLTRVGGGFSTLEFGQLEGRFTHYNWMGSGRQLDLRASVGNLLAPQLTGRLFFMDILPGEVAGVDEGPFRVPTWQLSADYQQPGFRGAENVLSLGVFANRRVIPGVSVDRGIGSEVAVTRRLSHRVPLSLSYRVEITSVEAGGVFFCVNFGICDLGAIEALRRSHTLSPVNLSFRADRSDHPLGPTQGYRARLDLEHASGLTASDFRYHRASGEASYYLPFAGPPRHVLAAHVRAGWVRPIDDARGRIEPGEPGDVLLHPRKRFFAGGARSVRGYLENQLGPRVLTVPREFLLEEDRCTPEEIDDGTCDPAVAPVGAFTPRPLGGTSVLEGSVEYRFPVGSATLAVFLDGALVGGRLGAFVQDVTGALTPGFGARFPSPAGPIRIDLGVQPRVVAHLPVVTETEVIDDEERRQLIQLEERRRYDPLEGEGTLGRIVGRLTLHFSIGEAF